MGNITICAVFADDAVGVRSDVLKEKKLKMEFVTVFLGRLGDTTKGSGQGIRHCGTCGTSVPPMHSYCSSFKCNA